MSKYPKFTPQNKDFYFKSGITWTEITSGNLGARFLNQGCIFSHKGPSAFPETESDLYRLLGFMTSCVSNYFTNLINPTITCSAGVLKKVPIVDFDRWNEDIPQNCLRTSKYDWDSFETSWEFVRHPLLRSTVTVSSAYDAWEEECRFRFYRLKSDEEELNRIFIDIYGLQDELTPEVADKDVTVRKADLQRDIRSLISYAVENGRSRHTARWFMATQPMMHGHLAGWQGQSAKPPV